MVPLILQCKKNNSIFRSDVHVIGYIRDYDFLRKKAVIGLFFAGELLP